MNLLASNRFHNSGPCKSLNNLAGLPWTASLVRRTCALALAVVIQCIAHAQPTIQWAQVAGSENYDYPYGIALGPEGKLFLVGTFEGTRDYQPEKVLYTFDQTGAQLGSQASRGEFVRSVAVDTEGNYFLTGKVWDPARLGIGQLNDFHLAKYSPAGALLWERTGGNLTYSNAYAYFAQGGYAIALDAVGHVYVAGSSVDSAAFDNIMLPASPGGPLLCKYDQDGTLLWVRRVEGSGGGTAYSIALDPDGNVVMAGFLSNGPADFGGKVITITGPYGSYSFVAKFNASGNVVWARQSHAGRIAVDKHGNIYGAGNLGSSDPQAIKGMFCGKFDSAGNTVWERVIPEAYGNNVALDGKDEPVFVGEFTGTAQLDGVTLQSTGSSFQDFLICKADVTGKFRWAVPGGGPEFDRANLAVCDRSGNVYVAGVIRRESGMLGPFPLDPLVPGDFNPDVFVASLNDPTAIAVELKISITNSEVALSWPVAATNYVLEAATSLPATGWDVVTNTPTVTTNELSVQLPLTGNARFFRLRGP